MQGLSIDFPVRFRLISTNASLQVVTLSLFEILSPIIRTLPLTLNCLISILCFLTIECIRPEKYSMSYQPYNFAQQFLNFRPLPQMQGSFRFGILTLGVSNGGKNGTTGIGLPGVPN